MFFEGGEAHGLEARATWVADPCPLPQTPSPNPKNFRVGFVLIIFGKLSLTTTYIGNMVI
jgi:hypothetical protein